MATETKRLTASLHSVTQQTSDTYTLRINASLAFRPGQSIQVLLPGDTKRRYYSVSSSPTEPGYVEITIKIEPGHALGQAVPKLKRGDPVEIEGPLGSLRLPDALKNPLCFIAAGTGVTPFRSMIKYLLDTDAAVDFWLLHSVKTRADLLFREEFQEWAGGQHQFHYVPTITRDFDDDWKNETGRITETMLKKHLPVGKSTFLLCGPTAFVGDMEKLLREDLKVPAEEIRREQW